MTQPNDDFFEPDEPVDYLVKALPESIRDLYDEIATLRQELADAKRVIDGHVENLHRNHQQIGWQQRDNAELSNERDRIRTAAQHVVDLYTHGNEMGLHAAIPGLREALGGGR